MNHDSSATSWREGGRGGEREEEGGGGGERKGERDGGMERGKEERRKGEWTMAWIPGFNTQNNSFAHSSVHTLYMFLNER